MMPKDGQILNISIPSEYAKERYDKALTNLWSSKSFRQVTELIKSGQVTVGGKIIRLQQKCTVGEVVRIDLRSLDKLLETIEKQTRPSPNLWMTFFIVSIINFIGQLFIFSFQEDIAKFNVGKYIGDLRLFFISRKVFLGMLFSLMIVHEVRKRQDVAKLKKIFGTILTEENQQISSDRLDLAVSGVISHFKRHQFESFSSLQWRKLAVCIEKEFPISARSWKTYPIFLLLFMLFNGIIVLSFIHQLESHFFLPFAQKVCNQVKNIFKELWGDNSKDNPVTTSLRELEDSFLNRNNATCKQLAPKDYLGTINVDRPLSDFVSIVMNIEFALGQLPRNNLINISKGLRNAVFAYKKLSKQKPYILRFIIVIRWFLAHFVLVDLYLANLKIFGGFYISFQRSILFTPLIIFLWGIFRRIETSYNFLRFKLTVWALPKDLKKLVERDGSFITLNPEKRRLLEAVLQNILGHPILAGNSSNDFSMDIIPWFSWLSLLHQFFAQAPQLASTALAALAIFIGGIIARLYDPIQFAMYQLVTCSILPIMAFSVLRYRTPSNTSRQSELYRIFYKSDKQEESILRKLKHLLRTAASKSDVEIILENNTSWGIRGRIIPTKRPVNTDVWINTIRGTILKLSETEGNRFRIDNGETGKDGFPVVFVDIIAIDFDDLKNFKLPSKKKKGCVTADTEAMYQTSRYNLRKDYARRGAEQPVEACFLNSASKNSESTVIPFKVEGDEVRFYVTRTGEKQQQIFRIKTEVITQCFLIEEFEDKCWEIFWMLHQKATNSKKHGVQNVQSTEVYQSYLLQQDQCGDLGLVNQKKGNKICKLCWPRGQQQLARIVLQGVLVEENTWVATAWWTKQGEQTTPVKVSGYSLLRDPSPNGPSL